MGPERGVSAPPPRGDTHPNPILRADKKEARSLETALQKSGMNTPGRGRKNSRGSSGPGSIGVDQKVFLTPTLKERPIGLPRKGS